MFDLGWSELLVVGIVALIVVGPKDLPGMFRTLGRFTAKARAMAREFQRAMDEAADEVGVKEAAKDLKSLKDVANPRKLGLDAVKEATESIERWDPAKPTETPKGPQTRKLAEERANAARKIREGATQKAEARTATDQSAAPAKPDNSGTTDA